MEKTVKEKVEAIAERTSQLKEDINKLLSDFRSETGCDVMGKIDSGVADIFSLINIEKIL